MSNLFSKFKNGIFINNENGIIIYIKDRKIRPKYCIAIFLEETKAVIKVKYITIKNTETLNFSNKSSSNTIRLLLEIIAIE